MRLRQMLEDKIPGGLGADKPDEDFDSDELQLGIQTELEHTDDPEIAKEIAKDHLSENPNYYSILKSVRL